MIDVGSTVVVLEPIGDGVTVHTVIERQWVTSEGEIVDEPTSEAQFILDAGYSVCTRYLKEIVE